MTTAVIVEANHGWPVRVTQIESGIVAEARREHVTEVPAGERMTFFIWSGHDLLVSEIQPDEAPPPLMPPPDE